MNRCNAVGSSKITEMSQTLSRWSSRLEAPRLMLIFVSHTKLLFDDEWIGKDEQKMNHKNQIGISCLWQQKDCHQIQMRWIFYELHTPQIFGNDLLLWRRDGVLYCTITHTCPKRIHFINIRRTNEIYVCFVYRPVCCVIFLGLIFSTGCTFSLWWFSLLLRSFKHIKSINALE